MPRNLLDLIQSFTIFGQNDKGHTIKIVARYQQFRAVKKTIKRLLDGKNRQERSGIIWHTQGSGKSLTMVMLTKYLMSELSSIHPQVVIITDRIELDSQIHKTFNQSRLKAARATSGKNLVDLICNRNAEIITSLVHKFDTASKKQT